MGCKERLQGERQKQWDVRRHYTLLLLHEAMKSMASADVSNVAFHIFPDKQGTLNITSHSMLYLFIIVAAVTAKDLKKSCYFLLFYPVMHSDTTALSKADLKTSNNFFLIEVKMIIKLVLVNIHLSVIFVPMLLMLVRP